MASNKNLQDELLNTIQNLPKEQAQTKFTILETLFQASGSNTVFQKQVFSKFFETPSQSLLTYLEKLEETFTVLNFSKQEQKEVLKKVFQFILTLPLDDEDQQKFFFEWALKILNFPADDKEAEEFQEIAIEIAKRAILSSFFADFSQLVSMRPISTLKDSKVQTTQRLFKMVSVFASGTWAEYDQLVKAEPGILQELKLDDTASSNKIRILTLAGLTSHQTYRKISEVLSISEDEVENYVISGISENFFEAKIDQANRMIIFEKSHVFRGFGLDDWKKSQQQLANWKQNIQKLMNNLRAAENKNF